MKAECPSETSDATSKWPGPLLVVLKHDARAQNFKTSHSAQKRLLLNMEI